MQASSIRKKTDKGLIVLMKGFGLPNPFLVDNRGLHYKMKTVFKLDTGRL